MDLNLSDILGEIQSQRASEPPSVQAHQLRYQAVMRPPAPEPQWKPEDKISQYSLQLSEYERYWLEWRVRVHLKSYAALEWSEMKDVLGTILQRLEDLKNKEASYGSSQGV